MPTGDDIAARGRAIFDRLRDRGSEHDAPLVEDGEAGESVDEPATDGAPTAEVGEEPGESGVEHGPADDDESAGPDAPAAPLPPDAFAASVGAEDPVATDESANSVDAGADAPVADPGERGDTIGTDPGPAAMPAPSTESAADPVTVRPADTGVEAPSSPTPTAAAPAPIVNESAVPSGPPVALDPAVPLQEAAAVDIAPPSADPAAPAASTDARANAPASPTAPDLVRPIPRIIAVANQKGGVGKTTTAVNLGAGLAELGYRVLVIDLDPQGNATTGLGINPRNLESSVYDVLLHDTPVEDAIEPTSLRNLFVVPATIDLAGAEIELVPAFSRELRLKRALEPVGADFDYTLIDCPPSLGLLTVNGLAAASEVLVPIQCEYYALEGLGQLLRNVNLVQGSLNPRLEVSTIVLTMYDARTKLADQVASEVRTHFSGKVARNIVPRTVRLSEAPSFGQPVIVFDPSSRGAIAYRELAKEVSGGAPQRAG